MTNESNPSEREALALLIRKHLCGVGAVSGTEQAADAILAAGWRRSAADGDGWIACAERMPEQCPTVLVWVEDAPDAAEGIDDGWYELAYWTGPEKGWYTDLGVPRISDHRITHWTPVIARPPEKPRVTGTTP